MKKDKILWGGLLIVLFILIILASTLGVANINFYDALKIILSKIPLLNYLVDTNHLSITHQKIVLNIRLPRILLAALVGISLASAGVIFQAIFKNPMAEPYILGVSSGAAFGATIIMILGLDMYYMGFSIVSIGAFIGAIITTSLVYKIAKINNKTPVITLLLAGIAISFFLSSLINLLMTLNQDQLEKIVFWTMGSLTSASWDKLTVSFWVILISIIIFIVFSRDLNVILMGEETAHNLGVDVELLKKILLVVASIMTASVVAMTGIIGFVGLIVPHAVRLFIGPDHKRLLPTTIIVGAIFMIVADTISRLALAPLEIPIGVVTALIGAPYFIFLLVKNKRILS